MKNFASALWLSAALIVAIVFPSIATWLYFIRFAGSPSVQAVYGIGKVLQFALPVLFFWLAAGGLGRWTGDSPPPRFNTRQSIAIGLALGAAIMALMLAAYFWAFDDSAAFARVPGEVRSKLDDADADRPLSYLALAVFYSLCHSFLEEYYWRWFVFGGLRKLMPAALAALVSALGFMAHHTIVIGTYFGPASLLTLLLSASVAIGGLLWAWLYQQSGRLYGPWLSHLLVDAGIMIVGYDMVFMP
jgi:membrane protease YdiL (CAAX protease family)